MVPWPFAENAPGRDFCNMRFLKWVANVRMPPRSAMTNTVFNGSKTRMPRDPSGTQSHNFWSPRGLCFSPARTSRSEQFHKVANCCGAWLKATRSPASGARGRIFEYCSKPSDPGSQQDQGGVVSQYVQDADRFSSYHMARSWGLIP